MKTRQELADQYLSAPCPGTPPVHNENQDAHSCFGCISTALLAVRQDTLREFLELCLKESDKAYSSDVDGHQYYAIAFDHLAEKIEMLGPTPFPDDPPVPVKVEESAYGFGARAHRTMDLD